MTLLKCTKCGESFPATTEHFPADNRKRNGLSSWCRSCKAAICRQNYAAHREERLTRQKRYYWANRDQCVARERSQREERMERRRFTRYGLTPDAYADIVERQSGVCAICGSDGGGTASLHIDHDHNTGRVRGLLCSNCNRGIGHLQDAPGILAVAIAYLEAAS